MRNFILIALLLFIFSMRAIAYDFIENGIAYNILSNGTLSVTHIWTNDRNALGVDPRGNQLLYKGDVVIPKTVTHDGRQYKVSVIGYNAFYCCDELTSLTLPEGIRRIEFQSIVLTKIKSLNIPSTVTELVPGAITQCKYLSTLSVSPGNPKYVSKGNCIYSKDMNQLVMVSPTLKTYQFPATVKSVADFAFNYSTITRLVIPKTVEYIGGNSFSKSYIGDIICRHVLKKLPDSDDFSMSHPLPLWAVGKGKYKCEERDENEHLAMYLNSRYGRMAKQL